VLYFLSSLIFYNFKTNIMVRIIIEITKTLSPLRKIKLVITQNRYWQLALLISI
jgi:hypothetical protein